MSSPMLLFSILGTRLSFRARLLTEENPSVINLLCHHLPLKSVLGHVVVSGETFWMPTRILSLGPGNMVERTFGAVYYYAPGRIMSVCYGRITESAKINQFGQVLEEDFENMKAVGELVYQQTVKTETPTLVRVEVRLIGGDGAGGLVTDVTDLSFSVSTDHWRIVKRYTERELDEVWLEEPDEFHKVRLGVIDSGRGLSYLMMDGADIIFRILQLTQRPTMTTTDIKDITRVFLTFHHFEFLEDLGLPSLFRIGDAYSKALDTVASKDEYVELTSALLIYISRMHRWIHVIFPWHLGEQFPHRAPDDVEGLPKLATYSEFVENV